MTDKEKEERNSIVERLGMPDYEEFGNPLIMIYYDLKEIYLDGKKYNFSDIVSVDTDDNSIYGSESNEAVTENIINLVSINALGLCNICGRLNGVFGNLAAKSKTYTSKGTYRKKNMLDYKVTIKLRDGSEFNISTFNREKIKRIKELCKD